MTDRTSRRLKFAEHGRMVDEWESVFPGVIVDYVRHGTLAYRTRPVYSGVWVSSADMHLPEAKKQRGKNAK